LGDIGTPDDLSLEFSEAFLAADEPVQLPSNANVAITSIVVNRSPSAAVLRCLGKAYRRFVILPKGGYKPIPSTLLGSPRWPDFIAHEQSLLYEPLGVNRGHCPIYKQRKERKKPNSYLLEPLDHFECRFPGCPFEMKIARVPGNLAILQKCTPGDTKLIPVEHDDEAHHASPPTKAKGRSSGSSSSILFAQKEFIIAEVDKYRTTDALASFLLNTKRIVATPHQKDHLGQFVKAVQQFKDRNRKFVESVPPEQMTGNVLLEVLELLKTLPHLRTEKAPVGESESPYCKTDGWTMYL